MAMGKGKRKRDAPLRRGGGGRWLRSTANADSAVMNFGREDVPLALTAIFAWSFTGHPSLPIRTRPLFSL